MRILNEQEFEEVFGGADGNNVTTLGTVTVTAPRISETRGSYWVGGSSHGWFDEYTGSSAGCYWSNPYQVLPDPAVPSAEKVRCYVNESAMPGKGMQAGFSIGVINQYGYGTPVTGGTELTLSVLDVGPGGSNGYAGWTYTQGNPTTGAVTGGSSSLFAAGMLGSGTANLVSHPYYDAVTGTYSQTGYNFGKVSYMEQMVLTMAHESYHQWYNVTYGLLAPRQSDAYAEGYGVQALLRYRANKAAIDAKCAKK